MADFTTFLAIFVKCDPLLRIFLTKWDPFLRIFGEKVTHLGGSSPYTLMSKYSLPPLGSVNWLSSLTVSYDINLEKTVPYFNFLVLPWFITACYINFSFYMVNAMEIAMIMIVGNKTK